jgi:O-antigen/teichoic acid export membrane protein
VKGEISTFIVTHGGIRRAIGALYRRLINSDFVRKVAETFGTRILLIGIGLVTSVIVARILGPDGRGLYAVAATIGAIGVQFGNLGLHASNTYYVARDRSLLPALVGNPLLIGFVFGGFGAAVRPMVSKDGSRVFYQCK